MKSMKFVLAFAMLLAACGSTGSEEETVASVDQALIHPFCLSGRLPLPTHVTCGNNCCASEVNNCATAWCSLSSDSSNAYSRAPVGSACHCLSGLPAPYPYRWNGTVR